MRGARFVVALALAGTAGCTINIAGFVCARSEQCVDGAGRQGACEGDGHCSFADDTCLESGRRYATYAGSRSGQCVAGPNPEADAGRGAGSDAGDAGDAGVDAGMDGGFDAGVATFFESFSWKGPHAAFLVEAATGRTSGNTVFWNPDVWDTRAGLEVGARDSLSTIDVRRGLDDPTNGRPLMGTSFVDFPASGGSGVGFMHFLERGVSTARLRNPGLLSSDRPLVVTFYANAFVTAGHWWEVLITPSSPAVSADVTAEAFEGGGQMDYVRVRYRGVAEPGDPCAGAWRAAFEVLWQHSNVSNVERSPAETLVPMPVERLRAFSISFGTHHVEVRQDLDGEGVPKDRVHGFRSDSPLGIPWKWSEVSVHLVGVALDASKTPSDEGCGDYFNAERFIAWRDVRVTPVKFERTTALPRQERAERTPRALGWMTYDVRDLEHWGVVGGIDQPNSAAFDNAAPGIACAGEGAGLCHSQSASATLRLAQKVETRGIAAASLVYDIRGSGTAMLSVNGVKAGQLTGAADAVRTHDTALWVRRSVSFSRDLLQAGENVFDLSLEGDVDVDRVELELAY